MVRRRTPPFVMVALTLAALLLAASSAHAAFPGSNGRISLTHSLNNYFEIPSGWTMNANGTDQRTIAAATFVDPSGGGPAREVQSALRFSPDGRRVVYSWFPFTSSCVTFRLGQPTQLRIANADGTGVRDLTQPVCGSALNGAVTLRNNDADPAWSPDSARIVFSSRRRCIQQRDPDCQSKTEIWSVRASDGQDLRQLTAGPNDGQPNWGTNNKIVFVRAGDLWTMNPDGSGQTQITSGAGDDAEPNWSPDGQRIVFASNRDEPGPDCVAGPFRCHYDIFTINANGSGLTKLTNRPGKQDISPVFSPDGRKIAWTGDGPVASDIWTMNADGTEQTDVTNATRPDPPLNCCSEPFGAFYMTPDWQPLSGVPPALPAAAMRMEVDPSLTYAGQPSTSGTVYISERAPAGGKVVSLSSSDPAHASVPATVTIPAGSQQTTYTVTLTTPAARTNVNITATIPGRSVTESIDMHPAQTDFDFFITGGGTSVKAGTDVPFTVNLNEPAAVGGTVVSFTSDHPTEAPVPATVPYPEGISGGGFIMHVGTVTVATTVTLTARVGAVTHTLTFTISPGALLSSVGVNPASVTGPGSSTGTVTMTEAPAGFQTVHIALSSSNPAIASVPAEVTVTNSTIGNFTITVNQVAAQQSVTITATFAGQSKTATLTVNPPGSAPAPTVSSLSFSPSSVTGGTSSTGTVRISSAAPSGGRSVSLSSPNAAVTVPATVTVLAGQTSATFTATTRSVTTSTPVDVTASATGSPSVTGRLTVTPPAAPAADTVTVTRAEYTASIRALRVEATGSNSSATLTAFNNATGERIGTLSNNGGGQYRSIFLNVANPGVVRVTSSLGGTGTRTVTTGSGTVKTTAPSASPGPAGFAPFARSVAAPLLLHATPQVTLPAADPADTAAPRVWSLRLLPARFRAASQRGTLVSFTLSEPAKVTLSFTKLRHGRFVAVPARIARTLPAGRVRVRVTGPMLGHGVYRVIVNAADARAHAAKPVRARFVVAR